MQQETQYQLGFRFIPTEEELVRYYLHNKVTGNLLPNDHNLVKECDLYGQDEPWEIWAKYGGQILKENQEELYLFTRLKKKSKSRINRRVGSGTWSGEDKGTKVWSLNGKNPIGLKRRFRYEGGVVPQHEINNHWIMIEYSLDTQPNDHVVCRIHKREVIGNKKGKLEQVNQGSSDDHHSDLDQSDNNGYTESKRLKADELRVPRSQHDHQLELYHVVNSDYKADELPAPQVQHDYQWELYHNKDYTESDWSKVEELYVPQIQHEHQSELLPAPQIQNDPQFDPLSFCNWAGTESIDFDTQLCVEIEELFTDDSGNHDDVGNQNPTFTPEETLTSTYDHSDHNDWAFWFSQELLKNQSPKHLL